MQVLANQLFEEYLENCKLDFASNEFNGIRQPDYLVHSCYGDVICEVKDFEKTEKAMYEPIRKKIDGAREQFREYKNKGIPCVLILCNTSAATVSLHGDWILGAMYGDLKMSFPINQSLTEESICLYHGKDGKLRNSNTTFSAISVLEKIQPISGRLVIETDKRENPHFYNEFRKAVSRKLDLYNEYPVLNTKVLRLRIYHNLNAAYPLDERIFNCGEDEQYKYDSGSNQFVQHSPNIKKRSL